MFSIKKIIKVLLIGITIFVILALVVNFFFLPATKGLIANSNDRIYNVKTQVVTMDLPIRVMDNVLTQIKNDPGKFDNEKLITAYNSNLVKLQVINEEIIKNIGLLENDLHKLDQYSFSIYQSKIKAMEKIIIVLTTHSNEMQANLESSKFDNTDIDAIIIVGNELNLHVDQLESWNQGLNNEVLSVYTWTVNLIFLVMVLALLLLSLGIYKLVTYDQVFVLESFKRMEQKSFDFEKLPKTPLIFKEEHIIHDTVKLIFEEEGFAQKIKSVILSTYHIDDLIQLLFEEMSEIHTVDRIGIAFIDYSRQKFVAEYGTASYNQIKLGPGFEVSLDKTSLSKIITTKASYISNDLEQEYQERPLSAALGLLRDEGIQSNLVVPLHMGEAVFGAIFLSSLKRDHFDERDMRRAEKIIYEISGFLNRAYFTKVILSKITNSFSELVDQKDNETGGHILRMVAYSVLIAKGLKCKQVVGYEVDEKFVLEIERNASSHDIGKVGIPDEILKKPGKLNDEEWVVMKTHAEVGANIFKSLREGLQVFDSDFYAYAEVIARYHHERFDGTGYPEGLSGQDIPLAARIVAVADVFDALTTKRHYKDAFGLEKSLDIIKSSAGSHLDPVLVDVFLDNLEEIKVIQNRYKVNH
jgi:HD-GYP domain-containing protein (c-di-GMP phosphodiesterase class II)